MELCVIQQQMKVSLTPLMDTIDKNITKTQAKMLCDSAILDFAGVSIFDQSNLVLHLLTNENAVDFTILPIVYV